MTDHDATAAMAAAAVELVVVTLTVVAPDGVPEVRPGDDLVALLVGGARAASTATSWW